MKLTLILLLFFVCSPLFGQRLIQNGNTYTLTHTATDAAAGHLSGNEFAKQVGDLLKKQYPSKVVDPSVRLSVFNKAGKFYFQYTWSCQILKTNPVDADFYFDRRGTLLSAATLAIAKRAVQTEIQVSGKVRQLIESFERQFGNHRMPNSFVSSSWARFGNRYWYIEEYFIAAHKSGN